MKKNNKLKLLTASIITMVSSYIVISNRKKEEKLYKLAYIDEVTKLGNKNFFMQKGKEFLENIKNNTNNYLMVLDIDKFKSFNKRYGHQKGNELLYSIGQILTEILNKEAIIARLANDAFGIIFEARNDIEKILTVIKEKISKIKIENKEYHIYISIGTYKIKENEKEIEKILDKALIAHDKIKGNYNKQYMIYNETLEKEIEKEHDIELNMQQALENEEFEVYYQPKINVKTNKIEGAEALVRWKKGDKIIPPSDFIPIFEKNQFIIKLDTYILKKVCKDLEKWKKKYKNISIPLVSVNVSKEHLTRENFKSEYESIVKKRGITPKEIEIEITETATIEKDIISMIKEIKEAGFIISIDDFGTGYSSLSMLQDMSIDTIKIDKIFIDQINLNDTKKNIIEYIILIAKKLKIKTVAEGVENKEQVEYLKKLGCDFIQGYYYFKPLTKKEFEKQMNDRDTPNRSQY